MKVNILFTGLCLQGNKGAAAMSLSLMHMLGKYLDADYCFAVPERDLAEEQKWALKYGVSVVPTISFRDWIPPWSWKTPNRFRYAFFLKALEEADVVVDASGISFVGSPITSWKGSVLRALSDHQWRILADRCHKPLFRWTQSYGPFSNRLARLIARREFSKAPFLMARGHISRRRLDELGVNCQIYEFPDVAFCLSPTDSNWADTYLHDKLRVPIGQQLIGFSPNTNIEGYRLQVGVTGKAYINFCVELISRFLDPEWSCVLIPYMMRVNRLTNDDLKVALRIWEKLSPNLRKRVYVVKDNLDCRELESLVGRMDFFVGARYHSLIAALSMGVPAIAIGWHEKYSELFHYFGLDDAVIDARDDVSISDVTEKANYWFDRRKSIKMMIENALPSVIQDVETSVKILAESVLGIQKQSDAKR